MNRNVASTVVVAVLVMPGAAMAQQRFSVPAQATQSPAPTAPTSAPASVPAPVPTEPQSTVASFGDWVLRCARQGEGNQSTRICEVAQTIQVQGQQGPLAQIAFGRVQRADPLKLTMILPNNVSFPSTVRVSMDEKDTQPLDLAWRRCVPGACIAEADPAAPVIQRFRARTEPARLTFKDAAGRDFVLPISFRGLAQALDALAREVI
jgi:invasion protein IalB